MTVRIDEETRTIRLGVGDLTSPEAVSGITRSGLSLVRARWGQDAHRQRYADSSRLKNERLIEAQVSHSIQVKDYTAVITGRIDSSITEGNLTIVEEVKTVSMSGHQLERATQDSFPDFRDQLRIYLYLLECSGKHRRLEGRLVLVSLLDGTAVTVPVSYETDAVFLLVRSVILRLLSDHEQRKLKMDYRRSLAHQIRFPYECPRKFQAEAGAAVSDALKAENHLLLSAPTGSGKTAAVLRAVGAVLPELHPNRRTGS